MCCFYEAKTIRVDHQNVAKEPSESLDIITIRQEYAGQTCPICKGYGRLKCFACDEGQVPVLGGYQQCLKCFGSGIKPCPVCKRRGKINGNTSSLQSVLLNELTASQS